MLLDKLVGSAWAFSAGRRRAGCCSRGDSGAVALCRVIAPSFCRFALGGSCTVNLFVNGSAVRCLRKVNLRAERSLVKPARWGNLCATWRFGNFHAVCSGFSRQHHGRLLLTCRSPNACAAPTMTAPIATPSTAPASTSLAQCTPRYSRDTMTATAQIHTAARAHHRAQNRLTTTATTAAPAACPEGKESPGDLPQLKFHRRALPADQCLECVDQPVGHQDRGRQDPPRRPADTQHNARHQRVEQQVGRATEFAEGGDEWGKGVDTRRHQPAVHRRIHGGTSARAPAPAARRPRRTG